MNSFLPNQLILSLLSLTLTQGGGAHAAVLRRFVQTANPGQATLVVHTNERATHPIPRFITGKFAEHLGWNIYNGMDAQILRNPTFAEYPFWNGQMTPDGVTRFHTDDNRINEELRRQATRFGWPDSELPGLVRSRADALACFWTRIGSPDQVRVSPDTGPQGGRAQRVEVAAAEQGVAQWIWLPLHRQREYEFELLVRSPEVSGLVVALSLTAGSEALASARVQGLGKEWKKLRGRLTVPTTAPADAPYQFRITADNPGQFVLRHAFLRPMDHVAGADPDVIRLLKESRLPLLRWPGGNFVSAYHWEEGIGPVERRPTRPNYAWGAVEPNTFGTDEFIAFCRAVGCEPMICVNAGTGTPEEAARWIEYCNGPATSPMGQVRAANGHPEPFQVRFWEVGNELWGRWQANWTTARGYADRYQAFAKAMRAADPTIHLSACGAPAMWGKDWNDTLISQVGSSLKTITDHPLIGGNVPSTTDPLAVYRDFMAVPEVLGRKWEMLQTSMSEAGIVEPRLAVTELQLFAHLAPPADGAAPLRLTRETLPGQASITEAIYNILVYHTAVRMSPFVEMITHSATVNHGGGLRKERERVYANPCHYAQGAFAVFAGATPVAVEIHTSLEEAPLVLPDLKKATEGVSYSTIDALAALAPDGTTLMSIVHRGSAGPIQLQVQIPGLQPPRVAEVFTLAADAPWKGNSLERPEQVRPTLSEAALQEGGIPLTLPPYSLARIRVPARF